MDAAEVYQLLGVLFLFFVVLYGAYYVTKLIGKVQMKKSFGKNMVIIEILSVGQQKTIQLVKVGEEYMLIGVTRDAITFIKEINEAGLLLDERDENIIPFKELMDKLVHKDRKKVDSNKLGEEFNEHQKR